MHFSVTGNFLTPFFETAVHDQDISYVKNVTSVDAMAGLVSEFFSMFKRLGYDGVIVFGCSSSFRSHNL